MLGGLIHHRCITLHVWHNTVCVHPAPLLQVYEFDPSGISY